ncbi:MAG TPA: hypothetical protein VF163_02170 [Micromonosporaceae bacterium]
MKLITATLFACAIGAATVLGGTTMAAAHDGSESTIATNSPETLGQLAQARAASAKYHDVNVAIADGYVPSAECAALPGVGGMGYHYINYGRIMDGVFDVTKPEILLYAPAQDGLRLAGVEFFAVDQDQNLGTDTDRPSLFGVPFDGPMPGHEPGMPIHYDLHVWVWQHNPAGIFAVWNPALRCTVQS